MIYPSQPNRLDNIKYYKFYITLTIKSSYDVNNKNSDQVIKDLDVLIKNKDITAISFFNTTKYIELTNGFQITSK